MNYARNNNLFSTDVLVTNFLNTFRSEHTRLAYATDLKQFLLFCANTLNTETLSINTISESLCFKWRHSVDNLQNQTLLRKIAAIGSFFKFCQQQKFIQTNPAEFLHRPKRSHVGKTNILTFEEIKVLLEYAQNQIKCADFYQNTFQFKLWKKRYAILYVLFTVGIRVEELCKITTKDLEKIDENIYRLHLITKGNRIHAPIIHINTARVLLNYMKSFHIQKNQTIFEGIHRTSVYQLVKLCIQKVGITKKISPHSLRASLATHLHKTGVPLGQVKDLLNHKNIATTLMYTKISDTELEENATILNFDLP